MVALVESQVAKITALERTVEDLQRRLDRRTELDQLVIHEIHTPLEEIVETLDSLAVPRGIDRAVRDQLVSYAAHQARRVSEVVEGLLDEDTSDSETRLARRDLEDVDLESVIGKVLRSLPHGLAVRVLTSLPQRRFVHTSSLRLVAALVNLVENATIHGGEGPVGLSVHWPEDGVVELSVSDRGPGLSRPVDVEDAEQGLGLYLVGRLVRSLGGTVEVANRTSGGVRARIRLPQRRDADVGVGDGVVVANRVDSQ